MKLSSAGAALVIVTAATAATIIMGHSGAPSGLCVATSGLPDASCTPGSVDPRVTQDNIHATICVAGYTAQVRPPTSVTDKIKAERMIAYGLTDPAADYELDHLVSLELGGAPEDITNLWPEQWHGEPNAHEKDAVENRLHELVCSGQMPLAEAQQRIRTNWRTAVPT